MHPALNTARRVSAHASRDYTLAERAALICSMAFPAHLAVWRESLQAQGCAGQVPDTYLAAMRQVVAAEAASGGIDHEDAVAAAIAIAEIGTNGAIQAAKWLLYDLHAMGSDLAGLISAAAAQNGRSTRAGLAQARLDLLALVRAADPKLRAAALCLLGDSYLGETQATADITEAVAYRFYLTATRESCPPAAAAHYRLGRWYEMQGSAECLLTATMHFETGADLGCHLCLGALAQLQVAIDCDYAEDLQELADLAELHPVARPATQQMRDRRPRRARKDGGASQFIDSVRGMLRVAFA